MNNHAEEMKMARIAGILYLLVMVAAGFAQGAARSAVYVSGDAVATAANIAASEGLYRLGFAADLVAFMSDVAISVLLFVLLKPAGKTLSLVAASFRLIAHPAVAGINLTNHFLGLLLLGGADYLAVFSAEQLSALSMLFLDVHRIGYLIGGAFFGVHLLLLGILLGRSDRFPSILGVFMVLAGAGYLMESFGNFLFPGLQGILAWVVAVPAVAAELSLTIWLLVKGVRSATPNR